MYIMQYGEEAHSISWDLLRKEGKSSGLGQKMGRSGFRRKTGETGIGWEKLSEQDTEDTETVNLGKGQMRALGRENGSEGITKG